MPQKKTTAKKLYKAQPKIYGYFKIADDYTDDTYYNSIYDIIKNDIINTYPSFFKSLLIKNINKNDELTGSITINLQEASKDLTQEQFNHIVRIINKQSKYMPYLKMFFVSTNEAVGIKYTYSNYIKREDNKQIPNIYTFCETNDIKLNELKHQLQLKLKDDYMDAFCIDNKCKSDYNYAGGYFIKIRLNNEIQENTFRECSEIIRDFFRDNYQEDNLKCYYKTGNETNGKRYTATHPIANTKFIQDD